MLKTSATNGTTECLEFNRRHFGLKLKVNCSSANITTTSPTTKTTTTTTLLSVLTTETILSNTDDKERLHFDQKTKEVWCDNVKKFCVQQQPNPINVVPALTLIRRCDRFSKLVRLLKIDCIQEDPRKKSKNLLNIQMQSWDRVKVSRESLEQKIFFDPQRSSA